MSSPMMWLGKSDFIKGAVSAAFAAVFLSLYSIVSQEGFDLFAVDYVVVGKMAFNAACAAFVGYLGKNLMTDSNGKVFGKSATRKTNMKYLLLASSVWLLLILPLAVSPSPINFCVAAGPLEWPEPPPVPELPPPPPISPKDIAALKADEYGVSLELMTDIIQCESKWKPEAIGDGGNSHGLIQIHLPSHPYVTEEQAHDPEFAIDFLAKNLALGKGTMWTCFKLLR